MLNTVLARHGTITFSPILGILIGATLTMVIIILLIILRIRRAQSIQVTMPLEEKVSVGIPTHNQNTMSSLKPLLRSSSPRETDERDPDIIPAKFGKFTKTYIFNKFQ